MKRISLLALLLLAGCFSDSDTQQKTAAPTEPQSRTGLSAFQGMYAAARTWNADAQPVRLQSQNVKGIGAKEGKAVVWRAVFASPAKGAIKPFMWSGASSDDAPAPGISPGSEDTYNPRNISTKLFQIGAMRTDSDQAFSTAQQHGGKALLAKEPDLPVEFELEGDAQHSQLNWFVSYGESLNQPKLKIEIDCATGDFIKVVK